MGKESDAKSRTDVLYMQTLETGKDRSDDAGASPGELRTARPLALSAAALVVSAMDDGIGEGDRGQGPLVVIPVRTVSGLNVREHWRTRAARVKKEREATAWSLVFSKPPALPVTVTLTRVGPSNGLDTDNLAASCKGVRDEIAAWLGVDDRSSLVTWRYEQRRAKAWGVEVLIQ